MRDCKEIDEFYLLICLKQNLSYYCIHFYANYTKKLMKIENVWIKVTIQLHRVHYNLPKKYSIFWGGNIHVDSGKQIKLVRMKTNVE